MLVVPNKLLLSDYRTETADYVCFPSDDSNNN